MSRLSAPQSWGVVGRRRRALTSCTVGTWRCSGSDLLTHHADCGEPCDGQRHGALCGHVRQRACPKREAWLQRQSKIGHGCLGEIPRDAEMRSRWLKESICDLCCDSSSESLPAAHNSLDCARDNPVTIPYPRWLLLSQIPNRGPDTDVAHDFGPVRVPTRPRQATPAARRVLRRGRPTPSIREQVIGMFCRRGETATCHRRVALQRQKHTPAVYTRGRHKPSVPRWGPMHTP